MIMKKAYINPEMEVIKIAIHQQVLTQQSIGTNPNPVTPGSSDAPGLDWDEDEEDW